MVNKINNNEIETTEGVDTENTSYTENEFKEESQKNRRRFLKPIIIGALSTLVVGGAGVYAYDKYETTQKAKIEEAETESAVEKTQENLTAPSDEQLQDFIISIRLNQIIKSQAIAIARGLKERFGDAVKLNKAKEEK